MPNPVIRPLLAFASRLRFPQLTTVIVILFLVDLVVPDPIPFVDEIILGLLSLLFTNWRKSGSSQPGDRN